jgi:hypothetical protein
MASLRESGAHTPVRSLWAASSSQNTMRAKSGVNDAREPMKAQRRFNRQTVASPMAIHMWKPNAGVHAEKTPRPKERAISRGLERSRRAASQRERTRPMTQSHRGTCHM